MLPTAQPQSGLATSIKCWRGPMVPSEVLHVCASSPRRITVDPGGSSPTFPTCWLDCRQAGRPCSFKDSILASCRCAFPHQSATEAVSDAAQNSASAFLKGSIFWERCFRDWVCDVIPSALRDGSMVTPPVAHTPPAHPCSFSSSPRFSALAGSKHEYYVAWLSGGLTRHSLREVADSSQVSKYLDNPVPTEFPGPARTSLGVSCRVSRFATSSLLQSSLLYGGQYPHAGVSPGAHILAGPGGGTSLRSSTRCSRADGTTCRSQWRGH